MFVFQRDQEEDWKQPLVVMGYAVVGIVGSVYTLLNTGDTETFLSGLADVGGVLFLFAVVTEGTVWNMVMALQKIREARDKGREEGRREGREEERAAMIQALRDAGVSEADIQRAEARRNARANGS